MWNSPTRQWWYHCIAYLAMHFPFSPRSMINIIIHIRLSSLTLWREITILSIYCTVWTAVAPLPLLSIRPAPAYFHPPSLPYNQCTYFLISHQEKNKSMKNSQTSSWTDLSYRRPNFQRISRPCSTWVAHDRGVHHLPRIPEINNEFTGKKSSLFETTSNTDEPPTVTNHVHSTCTF
jgi:hypothetical protein